MDSRVIGAHNLTQMVNLDIIQIFEISSTGVLDEKDKNNKYVILLRQDSTDM